MNNLENAQIKFIGDSEQYYKGKFKKSTWGSSGYDLRSMENTILQPDEIRAIPTGICTALMEGSEGQVRPRSGLSLKGITVVNAPGTVDWDYRGEIKVILINLGKKEFKIQKGDRIAQFVLCPILFTEWKVVEELSETERGKGGFGSTGIK